MIVLYHFGGPLACHKPAIGVRLMPNLGADSIAADNVLKFDGRQPERGEGMVCGSCGHPIIPQWLRAAPC